MWVKKKKLYSLNYIINLISDSIFISDKHESLSGLSEIFMRKSDKTATER